MVSFDDVEMLMGGYECGLRWLNDSLFGENEYLGLELWNSYADKYEFVSTELSFIRSEESMREELDSMINKYCGKWIGDFLKDKEPKLYFVRRVW